MSAFKNMLDKVRNRNFGGTSSIYSCEPYISGYGFIKWYLPVANLNSYLNSLKIADSLNQVGTPFNEKEAEKYLSAACVGVTPPSQSIIGVGYDASAGVKFENMTKVTNGNTINIKYIEMSGIPIFKIHKAWVEYLREAKTGLDVPMSWSGKPEHKNDYCGNILYWTTKPDGSTVEYAALYSGVYPTVDPHDMFAFDVNNVDKVELDISYHVDYIFTDPWVINTAKKYAQEKATEYGKNTCWGGFGITKEKAELDI